MHELIVTANA